MPALSRVKPRQRPSKSIAELQPQSMEKIDMIIKKSRKYATTALQTLQQNGLAIGGHSLSEPATPKCSTSTQSERPVYRYELANMGPAATPTPISKLSYLVFEIIDGKDNTLCEYAVPAAERLMKFIRPQVPKGEKPPFDWPEMLFEYFMVEWALKHRKNSGARLVFLDIRARRLEGEMVASAQRIVELLVNEGLKRDEIIICIPATNDGMKAASRLKLGKEPIHVNMIEVTSVEHALACVQKGVDSVTIHLGQDKGRFPAEMEHPAVNIIRDTARHFRLSGITTRVLVSGFPSAKEVDLLVNDVDGVAISKDIIEDIEICESDEDQDVPFTSKRNLGEFCKKFETDLPVSLSPSVPESFDYTTYDNKLQAIESRLLNEMAVQAKRHDLKKAAANTEPRGTGCKGTLKRSASCMDVTKARLPKTGAAKEPVALKPADPVYKDTLKRTASCMDVTKTRLPKTDAAEEPVALESAAPVHKSTLKRTTGYMGVTEARLPKKLCFSVILQCVTYFNGDEETTQEYISEFKAFVEIFVQKLLHSRGQEWF
ncbi:transaldolase [Moniliophthora roreri]|nr:transaldolase [Moniliophthora roreri]